MNPFIDLLVVDKNDLLPLGEKDFGKHERPQCLIDIGLFLLRKAFREKIDPPTQPGQLSSLSCINVIVN